MNRLAIWPLMASLLLPCAAAAQRPDTVRMASAVGASRTAPPGTPNYDVVVEVPELSVDSIRLRVAGLQAHLALDARVANLVMITAGADVSIEEVDLQIDGVVAEAYAYVDLDNVARMVDRALTTLEQNPEILTTILATVDSAVGTVGGIGNAALQSGGVVDRAVGTVGRTLNNVTAPGGVLSSTANLLSSTVNAAGQTVARVLDSTGRLLEQTTDATGQVVTSRPLGSVTALPLVRETAGTAGQVIKQVRDQSGKLIEFTVDAAGNVTRARVLPGTER
jgi:hypothetical protein